MPSSICIIIPAYNESATIQRVISEIRLVSRRFHIVVINDGSTDDTGQRARRARVVVIDLPFNTGIGGALQTGFKYALAHGFTTAIQVDGDGQHPPNQIPKLLNQATKQTDLVIGSRFVKKTQYQSPFFRRVGSWVFSALIQIVSGKKIVDPTSGFRVYNQHALQAFATNYPIDFPEPESIVYLLKKGLRIKEATVEMKARVAGRSSIASLRALYLYLSIMLGILLSVVKKERSI